VTIAGRLRCFGRDAYAGDLHGTAVRAVAMQGPSGCVITRDRRVRCWNSSTRDEAARRLARVDEIALGNDLLVVRSGRRTRCFRDRVIEVTGGGGFPGIETVRLRCDLGATSLSSGRPALLLDADGEAHRVSLGLPGSQEVSVHEAFPRSEASIRAVFGGDRASCGLNADGTLLCRGRDGLDRSPEGTFRDAFIGHRYACAVRTDGSLTCWGPEAPADSP
jgi:hypothetical protein